PPPQGWGPPVGFPGRTPSVPRRIFAAGDNQFWYSADGGDTWTNDRSPRAPGMRAGDPVVAPLASAGSQGSAPNVLAIDPNVPTRIYVAVEALANGPSYFLSGPGWGNGALCNACNPNVTNPSSMAGPPAYCST